MPVDPGSVEVQRVLTHIGEQIRIAVDAGDTQRAAHFAGMGANVLDPNAPIPPAEAKTHFTEEKQR